MLLYIILYNKYMYVHPYFVYKIYMKSIIRTTSNDLKTKVNYLINKREKAFGYIIWRPSSYIHRNDIFFFIFCKEYNIFYRDGIGR